MRSEKELTVATKVFAQEHRWRSQWLLWSTLALYLISLLGCCFAQFGLVRLACSAINGLLIVRLFIFYHDYQHHTILQGSYLVDCVMFFYGMFVLSPPSVWNSFHDHHHKHNSKDFRFAIGSYPVMTCERFAESPRSTRWAYFLSRHPLTIATGYVTIFMFGMCVRAFWIDPRRHADAGLALALHVALLGVGWIGGVEVMLAAVVFPLTVACGLGSYLFFAQHNFPNCKLNEREEWSHASAALQSSSYMAMGPIMRWFTGNIGLHHIHHLNAKIPFYRLPEAMASMPELQKPASTTLWPQDVWACLRLNLWDPRQNKFVSYREAAGI